MTLKKTFRNHITLANFRFLAYPEIKAQKGGIYAI